MNCRMLLFLQVKPGFHYKISTSTSMNITVVRISTTQACILQQCSETRWRTIAYDDTYRNTFSLDMSISTRAGLFESRLTLTQG